MNHSGLETVVASGRGWVAMGWTSKHAVNLDRKALSMLLLAVLCLQVGAGVGMSYAAGFGSVREALGDFSWPWLLGITGSLALSFVGYYEAYLGAFPVPAGWSLPERQIRAVSMAGFGGLLAHGPTALDMAALRVGGADERDAAVRASAFGGLEYGVMAVGGCVAAIAVLLLGLRRPPPSFTLPWAIIPLPGFVLAFWLAERYLGRLSDEGGWRRGLCIFLESVQVVRGLFVRPVRRHSATLGMALFWVGDAGAAWCGLAAFGYRMNVAQLTVGFATGMVFTRRSTPLAGAGLLAVALTVTIWYSGAPLPVAVAGVFIYHVMSFWLPTSLSLATLERLRDLVTHEKARAPAGDRATE
jgi:hypothetical protein